MYENDVEAGVGPNNWNTVTIGKLYIHFDLHDFIHRVPNGAQSVSIIVSNPCIQQDDNTMVRIHKVKGNHCKHKVAYNDFL